MFITHIRLLQSTMQAPTSYSDFIKRSSEGKIIYMQDVLAIYLISEYIYTNNYIDNMISDLNFCNRIMLEYISEVVSFQCPSIFLYMYVFVLYGNTSAHAVYLFILPVIEILKFDWLRQILYAAILCFLTNLIFILQLPFTLTK